MREFLQRMASPASLPDYSFRSPLPLILSCVRQSLPSSSLPPGVEAAERAKQNLRSLTCYHPPASMSGATKSGSKRAFQIKLRHGLALSRVQTTVAVHVPLIVRAPTRSNFHPNGWAEGPCLTPSKILVGVLLPKCTLYSFHAPANTVAGLGSSKYGLRPPATALSGPLSAHSAGRFLILFAFGSWRAPPRWCHWRSISLSRELGPPQSSFHC
jgi:hypothetical protein